MAEPTKVLSGLEATRRQWDAAGRSAGSEMEFAYALVRAQQFLVSHFEQVLASIDLTFARYECLVALYYSPNTQLGLKTISERLGVHPTSITYAVDQLETQKLIERRAHPDDRRRKFATLTKRGRTKVEQAFDLLETTKFGCQGITEDEQRRATAVLMRLLASEPTPASTLPRTRTTSSRAAKGAAGRARRGGSRSTRA
jgi:DNA-binding MarR family transcriptional regulator